MPKENTNNVADLINPSEKDKAKAQKWFDHGRNVADKHNYDYAIECYINGLAVWPDAVTEGHKPLRAVAFARLGAGGKKPGMIERMKFSTGVSRHPLQGMLTAEKLLARDPNNLDYLEGFLRNAHKVGLDQTCLWLGPIFSEEPLANPKPHTARLVVLHQVFEDLGDRFNKRGEPSTAVTCYDLALKALDTLVRIKPDDASVGDLRRNLAGKTTIIRGKFEGGDFRESLRDADFQRQIHDKDRIIADSDRMGELIVAAQNDLAAAPDEPGKVFAVVDALLRRGRIEDEEEAIRLLTQTYEGTKIYLFKMRADDVRLREFRRQAHRLHETGDRNAALEHFKKQIDFEIAVFKERMQQYPTEAKYKYELGKRYFRARRYDEAIPILQAARNDPKRRAACGSLIAQCFFHKGYHDQAINLLLDAIKAYEVPGDDTSKESHYWLGRSYEAAGQNEPAMQTYGQIIQWDYNYADVRQRIEALQQARRTEADRK